MIYSVQGNAVQLKQISKRFSGATRASLPTAFNQTFQYDCRERRPRRFAPRFIAWIRITADGIGTQGRSALNLFVLKGENMAKELLDAIYAAEEEFSRRESEAKKESAQTVAQAKKDAEALIAQREEKAHAEADAELAKAKAAGAGVLQKANAEARRECEAVSAAAAKNRPAVIKKAADFILS